MDVIIGIDPHKASHTAVAVDDREVELGRARGAQRPRTRSSGCWRGRRRSRSGRGRSRAPTGSAICWPSSSSPPASASSTCRRRWRRGSGCWARAGRTRTTRTTPVSVAVDRVAAPTICARCDRPVTARCCGCWRSATSTSVDQRTPARVAGCTRCCASSPQAGSPRRSTLPTPTGSSPASTPPTPVAAAPPRPGRRAARRHRAASTRSSRRPHKRIRAAVAASSTTLTDLFGVGPIIAATLIGYTGDIARFRNRDHYAAYNGTAPVEFSSGGRIVHRLSQRGNRDLNHALHMAAICQLRHRHTEGRAYFDRKVAEGKTKQGSDPRAETADQQRRLPPARHRRRPLDAERGPGRTPGNDSSASAAGSHSCTPALRRSHSRTHHHATPADTVGRPRAPHRSQPLLTQRGFGRGRFDGLEAADS